MTGKDAESAVSTLYRAWIEAWNRHDAQAMADLVAPAGTIIGFDGSQMTGPDEVAAAIGAVFAHHQTKAYVTIVREIRRLGPEAILLRAVCGMHGPDMLEIIPAVNAIQTVIAIQDNGEWRIDLLQNTPAAYHGRPDAVDALSAELNRALNA